MLYTGTDQRDVDWPVGGGGDLQCVRASPAQCFSSLAQRSPAQALQWALPPVSLLLSAAPLSSPAVQSDISQWSGWDQWRAQTEAAFSSSVFLCSTSQSAKLLVLVVFDKARISVTIAHTSVLFEGFQNPTTEVFTFHDYNCNIAFK